MAITAKISSDEVTAQVTDRFVGQYFEARLVDVSGTVYTPGTTVDATFLSFEPTIGVGGYQRQTFGYAPSDVSTYADDGVGLDSKATVFAHDGSGSSIDFSHAVLVWSDGNVLTLDSPSSEPSSGVDGTYTNVPVDINSGSGLGLTVDVTVSGGSYSVSVARPGYGYSQSDVVGVSNGVLAGLGATASGTGSLGFTTNSVNSSSNAGQVLAVAKTASSVVLTAGNEAVFYWNLKQFGFYSGGN